jgi:hypothetical protein
MAHQRTGTALPTEQRGLAVKHIINEAGGNRLIIEFTGQWLAIIEEMAERMHRPPTEEAVLLLIPGTERIADILPLLRKGARRKGVKV